LLVPAKLKLCTDSDNLLNDLQMQSTLMHQA